ncbi:MAG: hypothetical protein MUF19_03515 [Candidatus Pacebacteria bacterium]|jgi:hypothetical protein|nr:hypothetical protein [Candidatus Paceibacterota bacterium]
MTNISKKSLSKEQEDGLFTQLSRSFANKSDHEISEVLVQLLGKEERVMIAKRFAAILLIHHQQSAYFIANTLNLSPTTVGKLLGQYTRGDFSKLVQMYKKPTPALFEIFNAIDDLLHLGGILPRYKRYNSQKLYKKL